MTHAPATYPLTVTGGQRDEVNMLAFDPRAHVEAGPRLGRPAFLAIVSSHVLAGALLTRF